MPAASVTRRRGVRAVATAAAVVAGVWAVGALLGPDADAAAGTTGTVTTAPATARVMPLTGVVEADGARGPLPDDLVGWLQRHPEVTVLGVRRMRGGGWGSGGVDTWHGVRAVSVEYERSAPSARTPPVQRVVGVPLLCEAAACTRLVGGLRVRTTFVSTPVTVVAVETRWTPEPGDPVGLLPEPLRTEHREAVLDVVRQLASGESL